MVTTNQDLSEQYRILDLTLQFLISLIQLIMVVDDLFQTVSISVHFHQTPSYTVGQFLNKLVGHIVVHIYTKKLKQTVAF